MSLDKIYIYFCIFFQKNYLLCYNRELKAVMLKYVQFKYDLYFFYMIIDWTIYGSTGQPVWPAPFWTRAQFPFNVRLVNPENRPCHAKLVTFQSTTQHFTSVYIMIQHEQNSNKLLKIHQQFCFLAVKNRERRGCALLINN